MTRLYPELPDLKEMWVPAFLWMKDRPVYNTDELRAYMAEYFQADPSLKLPVAKRSALDSYVNLMLARMTMDALHTGGRKVYQLTDRGQRLATKYAGMPMRQNSRHAA